MKLKLISIIIPILAIAAFVWLGSRDAKSPDNFSEIVKVALRDTGNKLLLANKDSTSLVLPIKKTSDNRYEMAFQNTLAISPDSLVVFVKQSLKTAKLPKPYIVEVIDCANEEVSYSFEITAFSENNIIPCLGRSLPADCYTIHVVFLEKKLSFLYNSPYLLLSLTFSILIFFWLIYVKRASSKVTNTDKDRSFTKIGSYKFYKDQNKLIKEQVEIKLSVKECELMAMLSANQNQVVKRELLVKEI